MSVEAGQVFHLLRAISPAGKAANGKSQWLCRCDCGTEKVVKSASLKSGNTKSCGCLHRRQAAENGRHGFSKLNEDDAFKENLRLSGAEKMRRLNADESFSAARDERLRKLNDNAEFKERQKAAASKALSKLHQDPAFARRRDARTSEMHEYNAFMARMEQEAAEWEADNNGDHIEEKHNEGSR